MNATWHRLNRLPRRASPAERSAWHLEHQKHCGCRPIPPALAVHAPPVRENRSLGLRELLVGADRRSLARSTIALEALLASPRHVREIARLTEDEDELVSMRALDLLEKLAHAKADWVQPHRGKFIGALADSAMWEVRLQIVRALPLLTWTPSERRRAVEILRRDSRHPQTFVCAWALDSLATFAQQDASLVPYVERRLREFESSTSMVLRSRARHTRKRLVGDSPARVRAVSPREDRSSPPHRRRLKRR
jgi:hypothetical protein